MTTVAPEALSILSAFLLPGMSRLSKRPVGPTHIRSLTATSTIELTD